MCKNMNTHTHTHTQTHTLEQFLNGQFISIPRMLEKTLTTFKIEYKNNLLLFAQVVV